MLARVVVGKVFLGFTDGVSFLAEAALDSVAPPPITEVYTDLTNFAEDFKNPNLLFGLAYRRSGSERCGKNKRNALTRWMTPEYGVSRKALSAKAAS